MLVDRRMGTGHKIGLDVVVQRNPGLVQIPEYPGEDDQHRESNPLRAREKICHSRVEVTLILPVENHL